VGASLPPTEFMKSYQPAMRAFELAGAPKALQLKQPKQEENAGSFYRELFS
jgi:hypothetical protein